MCSQHLKTRSAQKDEPDDSAYFRSLELVDQTMVPHATITLSVFITDWRGLLLGASRSDADTNEDYKRRSKKSTQRTNRAYARLTELNVRNYSM
jgi:hypothetical protein